MATHRHFRDGYCRVGVSLIKVGVRFADEHREVAVRGFLNSVAGRILQHEESGGGQAEDRFGHVELGAAQCRRDISNGAVPVHD